MNVLNHLLLLTLLAPTWLSADELSGSEIELHQLNLESQQALRRQQQKADERRQPTTAHDHHTQEALEHRQIINQRRLQAGQQRELGALKLHRKTPSSALPPGLRSRLKLERFRREQGQQLRRFNSQRRARVPIPPR